MLDYITQIKETCFYVTDVAVAKEFYQHQLGLELVTFKPDAFVFLRAGSSMLLCFHETYAKEQTDVPPHHGKGNFHFAFEVPADRYNEAKAYVQGMGLEIEQEIEWPSGGKSFYFRDPENNSLEVVQPGIWGF